MIAGPLERRQFGLLAADSRRRLLDALVLSKDADPIQFAIWGTALTLTPPLLVAVRKVIDYPILLLTSDAYAARVALSDRLFFIIYGMLASALLAALTWDTLFPDRTDQEIVGVLPVRPRTLAAARVAAAMTVSVSFAAAVNLPPGLLYSAVSAVHPVIGPFPRVLAGHVIATSCAAAFVFFSLMTLRAVVAICAGERAAERMAIVLQLLTIVGLVEVFLFLPTVLPALVARMQAGDGSASLPPIWFASLYAYIGEGRGTMPLEARLALAATAGSIVAVVTLSLVPARLMGRRALENRRSDRAVLLTRVARVLASATRLPATVRALFMFSVASLARSRRHTVLLATYLGLAIATAILGIATNQLHGVVSLAAPTGAVLALPLVFIFFATFGLRASFAVPTEIDANWPFRLTPPTVTQSSAAAALVIVLFAVLPIAVAAAVASLTVWPATTALRIAVVDLLAGIALAEAAMARWTKVPFASAHVPATESIRTQWPWYLVALNLFAFRLADLQAMALRSATGSWIYVLLALAAIAALHASRVRQPPAAESTFDAPEEGLETLKLSGAVS